MRSPLGSLFNKAPVPYTGRAQLRLPMLRRGGAEQQMRAMGSVGTLFAIVDRLATATSAVEWGLYRDGRPGQAPDEREEVVRHLARDIWARPNDHFTRQLLVETVQQHYELVGEGYLIVTRHAQARSIPMELWPVRPDRMEPIPSREDYLAGWIYKGPDGEDIPLALDEVIQIRRPNPIDPYRGIGAVQTIMADLEGVSMSAEWNKNFFANSAEPGGIVEIDRRLSDDEFDELRDRWQEQHQGVANAHRVAILEQGKWVDRKYSMRDMQFAELRGVASSVIREAFGIPKFAIGDVEDVNRATAEASAVWFAEQLTVPRARRLKQALNHRFLPMFGQTGKGVEFDYESPVPGDREADDRERDSKANAFVAYLAAGVDPDDAADVVGLPRMKVEIPEPPAPVIAPPAQDAPPAALPAAAARLDVHHHDARELVAAGPIPLSMSALAAYDSRRALPALAAQEQEDPVRQVRVDLEHAAEQLLTDWTAISDAQYAQIAEQIHDAVRDGDPARLADLTVDAVAGTALLQTALGSLATLAASRMADEAAEQGIQVTPPAVEDGLINSVRPGGLPLVNFGAELISIAAATAGLLASNLAVVAGREALRLFTPGAAAAEIASRVVGFLRERPSRGLRDTLAGALHRATNLGRLATLQEAPRAIYIATEVNDPSRCLPCKQIDGTVFDDLAAAWGVYGGGGYPWCKGGDRCRGTIRARWSSDA